MYLEKSGHFRTDSMFLERIARRHKNAGITPVYSLSERSNREDTQNLYNLFMECVDEYDFAIKAFGSKQHLDKLKTLKWFMEGFPSCLSYRGYATWLDDMEIRDASIAKATLFHKAKDGDVNAAKKLLDMTKPSTTKGRPKKEDIAKAAAKKADEMTEIEQDIKRLNVVKLRG